MPTDKEIAEVYRSIFKQLLFSLLFVFNIKIAIAYQLLCEYCNGPCIGNYLRCRICIRTYHSQCLYERNHVSERAFLIPRLGKQDWTCPECVCCFPFFFLSI